MRLLDSCLSVSNNKPVCALMEIENIQTAINSIDFTFMIWSKVIQVANIDIIFLFAKKIESNESKKRVALP